MLLGYEPGAVTNASNDVHNAPLNDEQNPPAFILSLAAMESCPSNQSLVNILTLDVDGVNWLLFKRKFIMHLKSLGIRSHLLEENRPAKSYEELEEKPMKKSSELDSDYKKWFVRKISSSNIYR